MDGEYLQHDGPSAVLSLEVVHLSTKSHACARTNAAAYRLSVHG